MNCLLNKLQNKSESSCYVSLENKFIVHHYKNFIESKYCDLWIAWIKKNIKFPKKNYIMLMGKQILTPRLQTSFGDEGAYYTFSGTTVYPNPWKKQILILKKIVEDLANYKFNFCLLNYYRNGDDYIGPHSDKEKDLDKNAPIASLTFGADRLFKFENNKHKMTKKFVKKFIICNGDIVIFYPITNEYHKHSVPKQKNIKKGRWNFTFRKIII